MNYATMVLSRRIKLRRRRQRTRATQPSAYGEKEASWLPRGAGEEEQKMVFGGFGGFELRVKLEEF
jgi:hypothetical protein